MDFILRGYKIDKEANMKFAICNEIFKDWNWSRACEFIASTGYEGVEIAPFTIAEDVRELDEERRREIRDIAEKNRLRIVGLHWLLFSPPGLHITHPDPTVRKNTAIYLKQLVKFCHSLGGKVMVFGSPKQRAILPEVKEEEARLWAKDVFLEVLEEAEKKKVFICLEPLSPKETNFINTAEEAIKLIEEISHPYFRLHLDVKAMSSEGKDIGEIIRKSAQYLEHFHANDASGKGPGLGDTDFRPIMKALMDINYQGFVSVEVFDTYPSPELCALKSLQYLKEVAENALEG